MSDGNLRPYYVRDLLPGRGGAWTLHGAWSHGTEDWRAIAAAGSEPYLSALTEVLRAERWLPQRFHGVVADEFVAVRRDQGLAAAAEVLRAHEMGAIHA